MKWKTKFALAALVSSLSLSINASPVSTLKIEESYRVEIPKLRVNLDNGRYEITVFLKWQFKPNAMPADYTDSNLIVKDVKTFLANYPAKTDFWEVVNHKLTLFLADKYPHLQSITSKLVVPASMFDPYPHSSKVTVTR